MTPMEPTTPGAGAGASAAETPDEADLIRRSQAGDKEAFGAIVKRYAGAATGAAYLLVGNHEDALDASQEAFVRAWRSIGTFDTAAPFYPWYATILRNVCISALRRRRKTVSLDAAGVPPKASTAYDPVVIAERGERQDALR